MLHRIPFEDKRMKKRFIFTTPGTKVRTDKTQNYLLLFVQYLEFRSAKQHQRSKQIQTKDPAPAGGTFLAVPAACSCSCSLAVLLRYLTRYFRLRTGRPSSASRYCWMVDGPGSSQSTTYHSVPLSSRYISR